MSLFDRYKDAECRAAMVDWLIDTHCPNMVGPGEIHDPRVWALKELRAMNHIGLAGIWSEMQEKARAHYIEQYNPWPRM